MKKQDVSQPAMVPRPFPAAICLETTNACNLRCVQCLYRGGTTDHYRGEVGFMPIDLARKVLAQLHDRNCSVLLNGDGEALLHPEFHGIARYACELNLPAVYFNTNGTLMTPQFSDELVTYFKGAVQVSLDGFKESHEQLRCGSSYEKVISHLDSRDLVLPLTEFLGKICLRKMHGPTQFAERQLLPNKGVDPAREFELLLG